MQTDFQEFLSCWQEIAYADGRFRLPSRSEVTASQFHRFLPTMTIAKWDVKTGVPEILYCGTRLDELTNRDIKNSPLKAMFAPGPYLAKHVEVAMKVIRDQVGAVFEVDVCTRGGEAFPVSQLRLPLAPENGRPLIMSVYRFSEGLDSPTITGSVSLENVRDRYIELTLESLTAEVRAAG